MSKNRGGAGESYTLEQALAREWLELGSRLAIANPDRFRQVLSLVRRLTHSQEVLAEAAAPAEVLAAPAETTS